MTNQADGLEKLNTQTQSDAQTLPEILKREKRGGVRGGIYHKIQVELTYNSNHIEGSRLTHDQTRYIYETNTISTDSDGINADDNLRLTKIWKSMERSSLCEFFLLRMSVI